MFSIIPLVMTVGSVLQKYSYATTDIVIAESNTTVIPNILTFDSFIFSLSFLCSCMHACSEITGERNMKLKRIALGLTVVALMISIVPSVFACIYTPGYWKHNVRVYVEGQGSYSADIDGVKESDASMERYEAYIRANIDSGFTLEWANTQFWARGHSVQTRRQILADWFNEAKAD